jgi:hypothetical protein
MESLSAGTKTPARAWLDLEELTSFAFGGGRSGPAARTSAIGPFAALNLVGSNGLIVLDKALPEIVAQLRASQAWSQPRASLAPQKEQPT